jgi:hypothetical protein
MSWHVSLDKDKAKRISLCDHKSDHVNEGEDLSALFGIEIPEDKKTSKTIKSKKPFYNLWTNIPIH